MWVYNHISNMSQWRVKYLLCQKSSPMVMCRMVNDPKMTKRSTSKTHLRLHKKLLAKTLAQGSSASLHGLSLCKGAAACKAFRELALEQMLHTRNTGEYETFTWSFLASLTKICQFRLSLGLSVLYVPTDY